MFKCTSLTLKAYFTLCGQDSALSSFEQFHGCRPYAFISTPKGRPGETSLPDGAGYLVTKDTEKAGAGAALCTSVL